MSEVQEKDIALVLPESVMRSVRAQLGVRYSELGEVLYEKGGTCCVEERRNVADAIKALNEIFDKEQP